MTWALELSNISFGYQSDQLLFNQLSWQVGDGDFIALVGPNGGGKTTLLKLIMGIYTPFQGTICLYGHSATSARSQIGYVPQALRFDSQFPLTTLELVMMGALSRLRWWGGFSQEEYSRAKELLEEMGLAAQSALPFGALSGGQRQRALIARALLCQPRLLLLDEPTASVDAQAEKQIYELLLRLRGKVTMLMVTHDLAATLQAGVQKVACVQHAIIPLDREQICQHYALGLYHPPMATKGGFEQFRGTRP